jgi:hypothetical protein
LVTVNRVGAASVLNPVVYQNKPEKPGLETQRAVGFCFLKRRNARIEGAIRA